MFSGKAEITVVKPDGRVLSQVIHNNIVDTVYTSLRARIINDATPYNPDFVPDSIKVVLSNAAHLTVTGLDATKDNAFTSTKVTAKYGFKDKTGSNFTNILSGGSVSSVTLRDNSSDEDIATATTSNDTFTDDSNPALIIDSDDKLSVTYTLQIQDFEAEESVTVGLVTETLPSAQTFAERLMKTIQGGTEDISMATYILQDSLGGQISSKETEGLAVALSAEAKTGDNWPIKGEVTFEDVGSVPKYFEVQTSDGQVIFRHDVGTANATALASFVAGSTISLAGDSHFQFSITQIDDKDNLD